MVERAVRTPEKGLWIGPNIEIAEHVVIPQRTISPIEISVLVTSDSFPPKKDWILGKVSPLKVSVRSRFAQAGLDIGDETGNVLLGQVSAHQNGNGFEAKVRVSNRSARPIEILPGTGLFRLYVEKMPALKGYALERLFLDKKIKIDGKKGIDWEWEFGEDGKTPIGIYIKINTENRRWMPPHPEDKPLLIDDKAKDYRKVIDASLEDVPLGSQDDILWIGETPRLTLRGVNGVLAQVTHTDLDPDNSGGFGKQINSRLIDDETDWAIRVEILSKTTWGKMPNFVRMHFIKNGHH